MLLKVLLVIVFYFKVFRNNDLIVNKAIQRGVIIASSRLHETGITEYFTYVSDVTFKQDLQK